MSDTAPTMDALLECAVNAATTAGRHAKEGQCRELKIASRFEHDVKLALDMECQQIAFASIQDAFPEHAMLGEEGGSGGGQEDRPASAFEWIVDPIDGTVNFSHGMPFWCCSVAVRRGGEVLAGAVYAPELGQMFTATAETQACCNGIPIRVSNVEALAAAMIMTGMDRGATPGLPSYALFRKMADRAQKVRIMGCAALDICRVASGMADAYFESGIYIWDIAAAALFVRQAGGRTELLGYKNKTQGQLNFMASNGHVHNELKALLALSEPEK